MRERVAAPTILVAGAIVVVGPAVAAILVDRGHPLWESAVGAFLVQAVIALAMSGGGSRRARWLTGIAYAGLSWALVLVFIHVVRSQDVCSTARSVGTLDTAQLVVTAAAALVAVVIAVAVAAAARLPHLAVAVAIVTAFALALAIPPRVDDARLVDAWDALGHHYLPLHSYATVCGHDVNLETAPAHTAHLATRR
jgi:hypothetical protein